jgi:hypothetical protein
LRAEDLGQLPEVLSEVAIDRGELSAVLGLREEVRGLQAEYIEQLRAVPGVQSEDRQESSEDVDEL